MVHLKMAKIPAEALKVRDTMIELEDYVRVSKDPRLVKIVMTMHDDARNFSNHLGYDIGEMEKGFGAKLKLPPK